MAALANQRRKQRIEKGICISCGANPSFWGRRCIICRQIGSNDPLPNGARRALHAYRRAEQEQHAETLEGELRTAVEELLASKYLSAEEALALTLRRGLDGGERRTYAEVGALMNVTGEQVRQWLAKSRCVVERRLKSFVEERSPDVHVLKTNGEQFSWFICGTCHQGAYTKTGTESCSYHEWDLPNLILQGINFRHCDVCGSEGIVIEAPARLQIVVAEKILAKPSPLSGAEFRFLRKAFNVSRAELARQLGLTMSTLQFWENSEQLGRRNDLSARMVIAIGCMTAQACGELLKSLLHAEASFRPLATRVVASRNEDSRNWTATTLVLE